jgi:protein-S-isoprenylcysteine O-methyltransferase Ste14
MPYWILVILWVLFYVSHTWLASLNIKRKFKGWMGKGYIWYRLMYTLFSTGFIFGIFVFSSTISQIDILNKTPVITYLGYMLASFGTILVVRSFKSFSKKKFVGLIPHDDLDQKEDFIASGLHAYVRHPIYSGTVLIFIGFFFFEPTLSSIIHLIMLFLYLPFGIYFEEKKLIETYGEKYIVYKKRVPPLLPMLGKSAK